MYSKAPTPTMCIHNFPIDLENILSIIQLRRPATCNSRLQSIANGVWSLQTSTFELSKNSESLTISIPLVSALYTWIFVEVFRQNHSYE